MDLPDCRRADRESLTVNEAAKHSRKRRSQMKRRWRLASLLLLAAVCTALVAAGSAQAAVSQSSPTAWLLRGSHVVHKGGWTLVRLQGMPYQIGYQRCYLTVQNTDYWIRSYDGPAEDRQALRDIARQYIWPRIPWEYRQELKGEAAGLFAALQEQGASFDDQAGLKAQTQEEDLWDLVAANAWADLDTYAPPEPVLAARALTNESRCSAFIATGNATRDGKPVMGHNTWSSYAGDFMYNILFDVHPAMGYAFRYQGAGGSIWSGEDWYVNSAGLLLTETSLHDPVTDPDGIPVFVRARQAIEYSATVKQAVKTLLRGNNGAYSNEWLIGDHTGLIASLQLGCYAYDLHMTRNGFFGSSNYEWGANIRAEMGLTAPGDPSNRFYARYVRWQQLKKKYYGRIDAAIGMKMLADTYDTYIKKWHADARTICGERENGLPEIGAPLPAPYSSGVAAGAYDGKVTTERMALNGMGMYARWGHPNGDAFDAQAFLNANPDWAASNDAFSVLGLQIFSASTPNPWVLVGARAFQ